MKAPYSRLLRFLVPVVLGLLCTLPIAAQTTVADPNDPLYADIDAWATKGLVKNLPRLRPYAMTMAIGLLKEVESAGTAADAEEARRYLAILGDGAIHPRADVRADAALSSSGIKHAVMAAPGIAMNTVVGERLGISARMDVWLAQGDNPANLVPYGTGYDRDPLYGSGSSIGGSLEVAQDLVSDLTYGNDSLGVQAGFMRGSWGPIYDDGIVLGPQSPESGQLTFSWRSPALTADVGFFMLQQGWSDQSPVRDVMGQSVGLNSGKYLMIHGVNWAPTSWLELGLTESVVWVDRIEPLYFLPLSEYFISHGLSNYTDKSHAGLSASVYFPHSMKLDLVGYVDDLNFSGVLHGDWDTKWKMAAQACFSWAPQSPVLQRLSLDYTAVGPYMYTQYLAQGADANGNAYYGADAYTNAGQNIGPALDPDSDRVTLQAKSKDIDGVTLSGVLRLIRHGNASSGVAGYSAATSANNDASGDLADCGLISQGQGLFAWIFQGNYNTGTWPMYLRFLTQSVLQVSAQAGLSIDYTKRVESLGTLDASFGYTFEYIANSGCVDGVTEVNHHISLSVGFAF